MEEKEKTDKEKIQELYFIIKNLKSFYDNQINELNHKIEQQNIKIDQQNSKIKELKIILKKEINNLMN